LNVYKGVNVQKRLAELMEMAGFNDLAVNAEHLKVLRQDKDLSNKMRAIAEYNKITGRSAQENGPGKITVNIVNFEDNANNDSTSLRPQFEAVSARNIGEQGEEQDVSDTSESWKNCVSGEQTDNGGSEGGECR